MCMNICMDMDMNLDMDDLGLIYRKFMTYNSAELFSKK